MRRALLVLLVLAAAWLGARRLHRLWVGEEVYVRRAIADAVEGFDAASLRRVVRVLAPGWRDESTGIDRDLFSLGLLELLRDARDPRTGRFLYDLDVPPEELSVALDPDEPGAADVALRLVLRRGATEPREVVWEAAVEARLHRIDGDWRVTESRHRTLAGHRPGR